MVHIPTAARMLAKSVRYPDRAIKGAMEIIKLRRMDPLSERQLLLNFLSEVFNVDAHALEQEFMQSEFAGWMRTRRDALANYPGPYRFGSTPEADGESLYFVVRALQPQIVVETGVCYGASSAYILAALAANGKGKLYSIDLGNAPDEPPNDYFVSQALRERWQLIIGDSKKELPALLKKLPKIDLFHHDSLHTYEHMMWEYETAFRHLSPTGVLSSHDVNAILSLKRPFRRNPFDVFCERHVLRAQTALNYGLAVNPTALRAKQRASAPQREELEIEATRRRQKRA